MAIQDEPITFVHGQLVSFNIVIIRNNTSSSLMIYEFQQCSCHEYGGLMDYE
jgi:hypothetical protein